MKPFLNSASVCLMCLGVLLGSCKAQDLSGLSWDDRQSIEIACINAKAEGPATYHNCLNTQLRALAGLEPPKISDLSWDDRQSIEIACINAKAEGPATYHNCISAQLHALGVSRSISASVAATTGQLQGSAGPKHQQSDATVPSHPAYPQCAENGSCYGDISPLTGLPKTILVHGYFRSDGTYVRGYYRSK